MDQNGQLGLESSIFGISSASLTPYQPCQVFFMTYLWTLDTLSLRPWQAWWTKLTCRALGIQCIGAIVEL